MMNGNFVTGTHYLYRGFSLIKQPGLRLFVIVPLLINTIIFALLFNAVIQQFSEWLDAMMEALPSFLDFLRWLIWPMLIILLLAICAYSFSMVANIIASPFNSLLAEKVEEHLTGQPISGPENFGQALLMFPKSIARELQKLLYYLPLAIAALILTFIPAINFISPVIWFLLGSWMMALQYIDVPVDNHQRRFNDTKQLIKSQRLTSYGFGTSVMIGTMIPIVNFIIMPAAVCGATALWVDELKTKSI